MVDFLSFLGPMEADRPIRGMNTQEVEGSLSSPGLVTSHSFRASVDRLRLQSTSTAVEDNHSSPVSMDSLHLQSTSRPVEDILRYPDLVVNFHSPVSVGSLLRTSRPVEDNLSSPVSADNLRLQSTSTPEENSLNFPDLVENLSLVSVDSLHPQSTGTPLENSLSFPALADSPSSPVPADSRIGNRAPATRPPTPLPLLAWTTY